MEPQTRYARLGEARIAYQVAGDGPPDLVVSAGTYGNIDLDWEDPMAARMYRRVATFSRLIRFDRRGSGSSDPLPLDALPPWEAYMEEVVAVMDAVGSALVGGLLVVALRPELRWLGCAALPQACIAATNPIAIAVEADLETART